MPLLPAPGKPTIAIREREPSDQAAVYVDAWGKGVFKRGTDP